MSLEECLFIFSAICSWIIHVLLFSFNVFIYYPLTVLSFLDSFSIPVGCSRVLLIVSFTVQKLFIFRYSQQFISAFLTLPQKTFQKKNLLSLMSKRLLPVPSSRILIASCLTFRSFIRFEFIYVHGVRKWSSFNPPYVDIQFSQYHLLKRLIHYSCLLCGQSIDHIIMHSLLGFLFCSIPQSLWLFLFQFHTF